MEKLIEQYRYHDQLYKIVLEGIKPEHTHVRLNGMTNQIFRIVGNLPTTQYKITNGMDIELQQAFYDFHGRNRGIISDAEYPSHVEIIKDGNKIALVLEERLQELTDEDLTCESLFNSPKIIHNNLLRTLSFIIDRVAYAIVQPILMRKAFGYEAMKYS